jgi:flagellar biosynthesis protein FlhF
MNVQRFSGVNSREAMRKVKAAFGDDALILSNRSTGDGIEIVAGREEELMPAQGLDRASLSATQLTPGDAAQPRTASPLEGSDVQIGALKEALVSTSTVLERSSELSGLSQKTDMEERLFAEVRDFKAMLTSSAARMESGHTNRGRLRSLLLGACFSDELAAEIVMQLPERFDSGPWNPAEMTTWLREQIALRLPEEEDGPAMIDAGGVFAFLGPTGSGKTTTTAKIAAKYVMRHGPYDLALVSTDYYRIGAHEQLREYANLLNVSFRAVGADQSLDRVLQGLSAKKIILIDTVGLSQRDERILQQFKDLHEAAVNVRFVLLLSGSSHEQTLEEVVRCYRHSAGAVGGSIDHCILTKLDETCSPALLVDKLVRHSLTPIYSTAGQRVPEDLDVPDVEGMLAPILATIASDPDAPRGEVSQRSGDWTRDLLSQGRQISVSLRTMRQSLPGFRRLESLWDISLLPESWQAAKIEELMQSQSRINGGVLFCAGKDTVKGSDLQYPHVILTDTLQSTAVTMPQERYLGKACGFLQSAESDLSVREYVFSTLPDADTLMDLRDRGRKWVSSVHRFKNVLVNGDSVPISQASPEGGRRVTFTTSYRGQLVEVGLVNFAVTFAAGKAAKNTDGKALFSGIAWEGTLRCATTGSELGLRHWISSGSQDVESRLLSQLQLESFPLLTRHARETLLTMPGFHASEDLRMLVASGLAASALRIEQAEDLPYEELRQQLLVAHGSKRSSNARHLLDALCYLFIARELLVPGRLN